MTSRSTCSRTTPRSCRWIRTGAGARGVPGTAGADLLARLRRARPLRSGDQRPGATRASSALRSSSAAIISTPGSVASPNRETEDMRDGSDAIADWPVLNALLNTSSGATWVSVHHGGGVGIGYSLHAGMVVVADGTREADEKLQRVLTCDPGLGVVRHADAGYPEAIDTARRSGIDMPSLSTSRGFGAMMIPERPSLERRVLAALDGSAGGGSRIPVVLGRLRHRTHVAPAAPARPDRPDVGTVHRRRADRDDAGAVPQVGTRGARRSPPGAHGARRRRRAGRARRVRCRAGIPRHGAERRATRRRRSCSTSSWSCARSRAFPACAPCCAISSPRSRRAATASC